MSAISDATVIPRVGVALLLVDHRNFVLIGKRIGSHGHGTLVSFPHLQLQLIPPFNLLIPSLLSTGTARRTSRSQ